MAQWVRFEHAGTIGFGTLSDDTIAVHTGGMFEDPVATGATRSVDEVALLPPAPAGKMVALWNNSRAMAEKTGQTEPPEPLYFIKADGSYLGPGGTIRKPRSYDGKVVYEGELGIVIGRECRAVDAAGAAACIFGYTCINDVTAVGILGKDPSFPQWTRAKSFDTFGVFGPAVATGLDPSSLSIRTVLNGQERQNYRGDRSLLRAGPDRELDIAGHDAAPRRRHLLRHLGGGRLHEAGQHRGGDDRRGRHAPQPVRGVRVAAVGGWRHRRKPAPAATRLVVRRQR